MKTLTTVLSCHICKGTFGWGLETKMQVWDQHIKHKPGLHPTVPWTQLIFMEMCLSVVFISKVTVCTVWWSSREHRVKNSYTGSLYLTTFWRQSCLFFPVLMHFRLKWEDGLDISQLHLIACTLDKC